MENAFRKGLIEFGETCPDIIIRVYYFFFGWLLMALNE